MTNKIEIPLSKSKMVLLLIVPLFLLISGPLFYITPDSFISQNLNNLEKIKFLGIVGVVLGLLLSILIIRNYLIKKTGLIIDKSGITDISNASYTGLVEWTDIIKVERKKVGPIKLIILHTDKPEKYINQAKKTAIRQMRKNLHFYNSPILIVSSRLKIKYDDLLVLMNDEFNKVKRATTES